MVYLAKFQENGGVKCGYVLKPKFLRSDFKCKTNLSDEEEYLQKLYLEQSSLLL